MDALILRFDAPLMSFGGVIVDRHNVIERFPGLSLFAGLLANALGWTHGEGKRISALQDRMIIASRWDIEPQAMIDYHTVNLGQPKMCKGGWTTRGEPEHRAGGPSARLGTHIRLRHYWANGVLTAALALRDQASPVSLPESQPDLATLEAALREPARPLFLGRKTCLPNARILMDTASGEDVLSILKAVPRMQCPARPAKGRQMSARWPSEVGANREEQLRPVYDQRNWVNQWHAGRRMVAEGLIQEATTCS